MVTNRVNKFVQSLRGRQPSRAALEAVQMRAAAAKPTTGAATFDTQALSKLGHLELIASTVVDGFLSGKHRSTHKGGCTDFAEFRPYSRGDDIRLLDWRHYARTDKYYVKRFDDETNLQALLVVDTSGSMAFCMSTVSKWRYAQMTSACLAHLLLRQRDSVGLALVGEKLLDYLKPQPRASHLARMLNLLGVVQPGGPSALPAMLAEMTGRLKRRGMVIVISDCFCDVSALKEVLTQYRHLGHDVNVFQIVAPEELTFPFRREAFFQDLELPGRLQVNPNTIRKAYLEEFQKFMTSLRTAMTDCGVELATISTGDDLGEALALALRRRAAMKNAQRTRVRA
ncbi:MAG: DUF58 domain-containing protein [Pirellulales bacterium]